MQHTFIKYNRSDAARELFSDMPANHLLSIIAQRARYSDCNISGLKEREAFIGDWQKCGFTTRGMYREALNRLKRYQLVTIRTTNKGTIATLISSDVYGLNNDSTTIKTATLQPSDNHQATNQLPLNKNGKKEKNVISGSRFAPPTQKEVFNHMTTKGNYPEIESHKFVNFYESKGWMVGKNKMKVWKSSVSNWLTDVKESNQSHPTQSSGAFVK
tara:strand:+ start:215 stop:859 length:645 start_codon:yes stop_codon:yes gene_type:complete